MGFIYQQYVQQKTLLMAIFREGWHLSIWTWLYKLLKSHTRSNIIFAKLVGISGAAQQNIK